MMSTPAIRLVKG